MPAARRLPGLSSEAARCTAALPRDDSDAPAAEAEALLALLRKQVRPARMHGTQQCVACFPYREYREHPTAAAQFAPVDRRT
jgi:hypothetical protein